MRVENGEFEKQVQLISDQLNALADGLANDGLVTASGIVLTSRQMIRALWTRLHPPASGSGSNMPTEAPAEPTSPAEAVPEPVPAPEP